MGDEPPTLPYGRQSIDDEDVAAVVRVLRSDYLTTGPEVDAFERELAAACGARLRGRRRQRHGGAALRLRGGGRRRPATRS